jgi:hypothetical protein
MDRTINPDWFMAGPILNRTFDSNMKDALNKGGMQVIDVYVVGNASMGILGAIGYTALPSHTRLDPNRDGSVVWYGVFPGDTVPHELGHALGLDDIYHAPIIGCADMMYGFSDKKSCSIFSREEISEMIMSYREYRQ